MAVNVAHEVIFTASEKDIAILRIKNSKPQGVSEIPSCVIRDLKSCSL
jgi:hypothetical protein